LEIISEKTRLKVHLKRKEIARENFTRCCSARGAAQLKMEAKLRKDQR